MKKILLPLVATSEDREALLLDAFFTVDPFLYRMDRSGIPSLFGSRCISQLIEYSSRTKGEHALVRLLLTMREYHEPGRHAEIDELIERVKEHCQIKKSGQPKPQASAIRSVITKDTPTADRPATVFISYSHQDTDFANTLIADLGQAGHACWIDTAKIKGGDEWVDTIAEAIRNSYALVVLVTKSSLNSIWVRKEILWAEQKQKLIIPMILEDVLHENRYFPLINSQGIKLFETGYEMAMRKLRESLPAAPSVEPLLIEDSPAPAIARIETRALQGASRKLELEYLERIQLEELLNITPLDPIRIREFAGRYLGEARGHLLFWKLAGNRVHSSYEQFWLDVGLKIDEAEQTFWLADQLPEGVFWGYNWLNTKDDNQHWQAWIRLRGMPSSLLELARNPYMLLMLCSVYAKHGQLPENRGDLFRQFIDILLERERVPFVEQPPLIAAMAKVAYEMQSRRTDDERGSAQTTLLKQEVDIILDARSQHLARSASILSVGEKVRFTHQLLQEYFAAKYMDLEIQTGRLRAETIWPRDCWWERTNWEEASVLLTGLYEDDCSVVVNWLADANPELAAICATKSGATLPAEVAETLRPRWLPRLSDLQREPAAAARANIGRALGRLGLDNRKGVGTIIDRNGVTLPDIDWVEIPGGEFLYGDKSEGAAKPQKLTLPTFFIGRYPITFMQFQAFLNDPWGFDEPCWFEGMAVQEDQREMHEQEYKFTNHPRDSVSWYQAMAFCRWFSWRLGGGTDLEKVDDWAVRLPTEFEWEKAARGPDGRIYPYEGEFDASKANVEETGLGQTSAVGIFPHGASTYGVMDMSGNVWEWCLSNYNNPAFEAEKENLQNEEIRVLRGGSWFFYRMFARAVYRDSDLPALRYVNFGFRVVVVVRPPSL